MIAVPIRYRRAERGLFVQKLQHAVPSIVVLTDGLDHLSHDPHGVDLVLGVVEVVVALGVMATVIYGLKNLVKAHIKPSHGHHHGVDWIDIAIGLMLAVEAYAKFHASGKIPRATILLAMTMLGVGIAHPRLAAWGSRRRHLRVDANQISIPKRPFFRVTLPWADVQSIDIDDRYATVTAVGGRRHRFDFSDMIAPDAVREALMQARRFLDEAQHASRASIESTSPTA